MSKTGRINLHTTSDCELKESTKFTDNYLKKYRDKDNKKLKTFSATQFLDVWNHFDSDNNGYIEASELDNFLIQFTTSVLDGPVGQEVLSHTAFQVMKREFLDAYDENEDGRIEIGELSQILPTDEEFLVLFQRENPLPSSVEFMKVWKKFDKDHSGYIESNELQDFVAHFLLQCGDKSKQTEESKIKYYSDVMLQLFDRNNDGKLQLSEMARLLPMKENYLAKPLFRNSQKLSYLELDRIFRAYDEDSNGLMDEKEIQALLVDLLELSEEQYDEGKLEKFLKIILSEWDVNKDGKINKKELKMILMQHNKLGEISTKPFNRITFNKNIKASI